MVRFFVGQRVRHVKSLTGLVPIGAEGRIVGIGAVESSIGTSDCTVMFDNYRSGHESGEFAVLFFQLEPILPEGHAQSIYSFQELMDKFRDGVTA